MKKLRKLIYQTFLLLAAVASGAWISSANLSSWSTPSGAKTTRLADVALVGASASTPQVYVPAAVTFDSSAAFNTNQFPSQVNAETIRSFLRIASHSELSLKSGNATASVSGFQFSTINTSASSTSINTPFGVDQLKANLNVELGMIQRSSISDLFVRIVKQDDLKGVIEFQVYQPINLYTNQNNIITPSAPSDSKVKNALALLTPPTNMQATKSDGNKSSDIWTLPNDTNHQLRKAEFVFKWKADNLISNFLTKFNKKPSELSKEDVKANFFDISKNFNSPQLSAPPIFEITLDAKDEFGLVQISFNLPTGFAPLTSAEKTTSSSLLATASSASASGDDAAMKVSRSFYGFKSTNASLTNFGTIFNPASETNILSATINAPLWDPKPAERAATSLETTAPPPKITYVNKMVKDLLPSQFLNPNQGKQVSGDSTFLSVLLGDEIKFKDGNGVEQTKRALTILGSTSTSGTIINSAATARLGFLSYYGVSSDEAVSKGMPPFKITKVEGQANNRLGTLDLSIYYQAVTNTGKLVNAPVYLLRLSGFATNPDSGETLYFSWNDSLPKEFATSSAQEIVDRFKQVSNPSNSITSNDGYSGLKGAKDFVTNFFSASAYVKAKYEKDYNSTNKTGAHVKVESVSASDGASNVQVSIKFARFGGADDQIFSKVFVLSKQNNSNLPQALLARISVKQRYLKIPETEFRSRYASTITAQEILGMFEINIPQAGDTYTTPLNRATVFSVPNDKQGSLAVSLILPKYNNIDNFEFSQTFHNFQVNVALQQNLILEYNNPMGFSSEFLAKNPLSESSLTKADVLQALFLNDQNNNSSGGVYGLLSPANITIAERKSDYIKVEVSLNWNQLTSISVSNQTKPILTREADTNTTASSPITKLNFVISGFTGGRNVKQDDQSPTVPGIAVKKNTINLVAGVMSGVLGGISILLFVPITMRYLRYLRIKRTEDSKNASSEKFKK